MKSGHSLIMGLLTIIFLFSCKESPPDSPSPMDSPSPVDLSGVYTGEATLIQTERQFHRDTNFTITLLDTSFTDIITVEAVDISASIYRIIKGNLSFWSGGWNTVDRTFEYQLDSLFQWVRESDNNNYYTEISKIQFFPNNDSLSGYKFDESRVEEPGPIDPTNGQILYHYTRASEYRIEAKK